MGGSCKLAFTLAEVLIVIGIIGLIADMTIPTLISSTQEKVAVTRLQKAHSTFESAYRLAVQENGTPENWNLVAPSSPQGALNILNTVKPYLRLIKDCGGSDGCVSESGYKYLKGDSFPEYSSSQFAKAQLADGTIIFVGARDVNCAMVRGESPALKEVCGIIDMDINGFNPPNQMGRDVFGFIITKSGIIPQGTQGDTFVKFDENCKNKSTATGWGCTAWVLYNGNMDYLHCNDLSWDGKKSCK